MKANELRIGNWVFYQGENWTVEQINRFTPYYLRTEDGEVLMEHNVFYSEDSIKPIPLTEEWLERFGFECLGSGLVWGTKDWQKLPIIVDTLSNVFLVGDGNESVNEYLCDTEYVHQLQNLYFALTGEELEIK